MEAIARLGAAECLRSGITTVGDLRVHGRERARVRRARPARDRLPRGLRQGRRRRAAASSRRSAPTSPRRSRSASASASRRTRPYTCSREVYAASMALGLPVATHLNESQDELDWLLRGEGPWQPLAEMLVEPRGDERDPQPRGGAGCSDERVAAAHCVKVDEEEIGLLAAPRRRRRALPPLERPARLRDRAARRAARRRAPRRHRHGRRLLGPVARLLRGAAHRDLVRARASRARRRAVGDRGARARDARRRPRARARRARSGSLVPGKRADLAIVSLSGSPYLPWEDPAAAVVYGGSPGAHHGYPGRRPDADTREEEANVTS